MAKQDSKQTHDYPIGRTVGIFGAIDNDLAIENMENDFDMTAADLQDLRRQDI